MSEPIIIELNDSGILLADASGLRLSEPGYARLTQDGIRTGEEARRYAFLEPQRVYHQFWNQLSLAPLANANGHARHHADLAYSQLLQLHRASGEPGQIVFSVPGTFSREQLSILLGLAQAAPFEAVGLVDSAVAAAAVLGEPGEWLHLDLHLHQAVLTRLRIGEQIERLHVQAIASAGLKALLNNWAQHIAHLFIRQYRYDPLHTAAGEQQLYDRMDEWLQRLASDHEIAIELDSRRGAYSLNLARDTFTTSNRALLERLRQAIGQQGAGCTGLLVSDRVARLPALREQLEASISLPADASTRGARTRLDQLGAVDGGLVLHTRLQGITTAAVIPPATDKHPAATHVLCGHQAHAIGTRLYAGFSQGKPLFTHQPPQPPWLSLSRQGADWQLHSEGALELSAYPPELPPGTRLTVQLPGSSQTHELILIEVS